MELLIPLFLFLLIALEIGCLTTDQMSIKLYLSTFKECEITSVRIGRFKSKNEVSGSNWKDENFFGNPGDKIHILVKSIDDSDRLPIGLAALIMIESTTYTTDSLDGRWSTDTIGQRSFTLDSSYKLNVDNKIDLNTIGYVDPYCSEYLFIFTIPFESYCKNINIDGTNQILYSYPNQLKPIDISQYIVSSSPKKDIKIQLKKKITNGHFTCDNDTEITDAYLPFPIESLIWTAAEFGENSADGTVIIEYDFIYPDPDDNNKEITTPCLKNYIIKICHENCAECSGKNVTNNDHQCTQCKNGFLRAFIKQYANEPIPIFNCYKEKTQVENFYEDNVIRMFRPCPNSCSRCLLQELQDKPIVICTKCKSASGFYPLDLLIECSSKCSLDTVAKDVDCITKCNTVSETCKSGTIEVYNKPECMVNCYNLDTIKTLPNGYYFDNETDKTFKPCHDWCKSCSGPYTLALPSLVPTDPADPPIVSTTRMLTESFTYLKNYTYNKDDKHNCISCKAPYGIYNENNQTIDKIIMNCVELKKETNWVIIDNIYHKCHDNCATCSNTSETGCGLCALNYYKLEKTESCVLFPRPGHYLDGSIIRKCYERCASCSMGGDDDTHNCDNCTNFIDYAWMENRKGQCVNRQEHATYYYNSTAREYRKCYYTCETCFGPGNSTLQNCKKCPLDYGIVYTKNECVHKDTQMPEYYYHHPDKTFFKCFKKCNGCIGEGNQIDQECLHCLDSYREINVTNKTTVKVNCVFTKSVKDEKVIEEIEVAALLPNITNNDTIIAHFNATEQENKYIIYGYSRRENITKDIPYFDLTNLTDIFISENITNKDLLISQTVFNKTDKISTQSNFEFYNRKSNGTVIDKAIFKKQNASFTALFPIYISKESIKYNIALELEDKNVNFYDPLDLFYSELCYPYEIDSKDLTLKDRNSIVIHNLTFCPKGCIFDGIEQDTFRVKCTCFFDETIEHTIVYNPVPVYNDNYPLFYCIALIQDVQLGNPLMISAMVFGICEVCLIISVTFTYKKHVYSKIPFADFQGNSTPEENEFNEKEENLKNEDENQLQLDSPSKSFNKSNSIKKEDSRIPTIPNTPDTMHFGNPPKKPSTDANKFIQCRYSEPSFNTPSQSINSPGTILFKEKNLDKEQEENKQLGTIHSVKEEEVVKEKHEQSDSDIEEEVVMPNANIAELLKINNSPEEQKETEEKKNDNADVHDDVVDDDVDNDDDASKKEEELIDSERQKTKSMPSESCDPKTNEIQENDIQLNPTHIIIPHSNDNSKRDEKNNELNQKNQVLPKEETNVFKIPPLKLEEEEEEEEEEEDEYNDDVIGKYDNEVFKEEKVEHISYFKFRKKKCNKDYYKKNKNKKGIKGEDENYEKDEIQKKKLNDQYLKMMQNAANFSLSFNYVIDNDQRRYWKYFWDIYQEKQVILALTKNTFMFYTISLRIFVFIFNLLTVFFFNALFHTPILISQRYQSSESLGFLYVLQYEWEQYLTATMCMIVTSKVYFAIGSIDYWYVTSDDESAKYTEEYLKKFMRLSTKIMIVIIIVMFGLMCGFYYYILIFFALYPNNILGVIWGSLISFIMNSVFLLVFCLLVSFIRFVAIDNNIK